MVLIGPIYRTINIWYTGNMVGVLVHKVQENLVLGEEVITVISAYGPQLKLHESIKKGLHESINKALWETYERIGQEYKDNKAEYQERCGL